MNEIDFSQLEKLQKQMERTDYTKACASAMNVMRFLKEHLNT